MKILKGFALAISMLTTIPFFKVHDFYKGINGYAVMFYPLVGFLLGGILWATHYILSPYVPSVHLGIIIFTIWVFYLREPFLLMVLTTLLMVFMLVKKKI